MFPINCLLQTHRIPSIALASGAQVSASALSRENLPRIRDGSSQLPVGRAAGGGCDFWRSAAARQNLSLCLTFAHVWAGTSPPGRVVWGWCVLPALLLQGRESKGTVLGLEENRARRRAV